MSERRCTLLSDASSDRVLLPVIDWLLKQHREGFQPTIWSDLRQLPARPSSLAGKIYRTIELFPCDLLFVHRDAEKEHPGKRRREIENAVQNASRHMAVIPPVVCIVPVRMQEAWFLFDERAIRKAAGNPNGRIQLDIPRWQAVESIPDPKQTLHDLLKVASQKRGRDLKQFNTSSRVFRVASEIEDFSPLRVLSAFRAFEKDIIELLASHFPIHEG